jgi:parvulin-like peptidyl-prolyl isomerase
MIARWTCLVLCIAVVAGPRAVFGQLSNLRAELQVAGALKAAGTVVAQVDNEKIDAADVNQVIKQALRGRQVNKEALAGLEAQVLEKVIADRLVAKFLDSQQINVSDAELDATLQTFKNQLASQKRSLVDYLTAIDMTEAAFRKDAARKLRWAKYCQTAINDAELQKFFDAHRADYDGRELQVSHVLFRAERPLDQAAQDALQKKAEEVRAEIESGKISFADAARKYSAGPSRRQGGDLGFIPRNGVMDEAFSKAAFALEKGKISPPVTTPFGVHLIQWTDARPGTKTLKDVQTEIQQAAIQDLFLRIAEKMRAESKVEYTDAFPHIDPDTKKIVSPESKASDGKDDKKPGDGTSGDGKSGVDAVKPK